MPDLDQSSVRPEETLSKKRKKNPGKRERDHRKAKLAKQQTHLTHTGSIHPQDLSPTSREVALGASSVPVSNSCIHAATTTFAPTSREGHARVQSKPAIATQNRKFNLPAIDDILAHAQLLPDSLDLNNPQCRMCVITLVLTYYLSHFAGSAFPEAQTYMGVVAAYDDISGMVERLSVHLNNEVVNLMDKKLIVSSPPAELKDTRTSVPTSSHGTGRSHWDTVPNNLLSDNTPLLAGGRRSDNVLNDSDTTATPLEKPPLPTHTHKDTPPPGSTFSHDGRILAINEADSDAKTRTSGMEWNRLI